MLQICSSFSIHGYMAVGNIVSRPRGILMEKVGNRAPYLIAALAAAFTLLITFLNLPEESGGPGESGDVNGCFFGGFLNPGHQPVECYEIGCIFHGSFFFCDESMGQMKVAMSGSGFIIICLVKCCRFRVIIQTHPHLMLLFPPICCIHIYIYIRIYIYAPVLVLSNKMLRNMIGYFPK